MLVDGGVPSGQESRVFTTMIMLMFWTFKRDQPFPSQRRCRSRCPQHYADVLGTGDVRVCLDCTEFSAEGHADLRQAIASFSKYKKGTTIKFLVAISASGAIVFVSYGYPGRITDPQITEACGIAELLSQGDAVLADRGFLIAQLLADVKAHLLVSHTRFSSLRDSVQKHGQLDTYDLQQHAEYAGAFLGTVATLTPRNELSYSTRTAVDIGTSMASNAGLNS